jgi:hypothetical protein
VQKLTPKGRKMCKQRLAKQAINDFDTIGFNVLTACFASRISRCVRPFVQRVDGGAAPHDRAAEAVGPPALDRVADQAVNAPGRRGY